MTDHTAPADTVDNRTAPPAIDVAPRPTQAHYYEITDADNVQRAALTVVLNAQTRVLHSELWLYDRYRLSEPMQADIYRRARQVVETHYLGAGYQGSGFQSLLRVLDGRQLDEEPITHNNPDPRYHAERLHRIWPYVTGYVAVMLILLVFLLLNRTVLKPGQATTVAAGGAQPAALRVAAEDSASAAESMTPLPAEESMPSADTNGLPPSKMADDQLTVGMTARILPGYRSFIRSEPGPDAGEPIGVLENGATALLLGGPVWKEGNTDTIVWWYIETATGLRGWTPANTSELRLLAPAE